VTAAFAHQASDHLLCDLDVDAPDFHLLVNPSEAVTEALFSGHEAVIEPDA